jgi:hypothetical protein
MDDLNKLAGGTPEEEVSSGAASILDTLLNAGKSQSTSVENTVAEILNATQIALTQALESEVPELEAKLAKRSFDLYRDNGFSDEQAIALICAKYKAPKP